VKPVNPAEKITDLESALLWRNNLRESGKKLVVTNGCFDIMHRGHASYLYEAACEGDFLLVLLNSDASVAALKGEGRPVNCETDRLYLLSALESVDKVLLFDGFSCEKELSLLKPDIYIKGGDYTLDTMNQAERQSLQQSGAKIIFKCFADNLSSSILIDRIKQS
jgi:D-beta-D-heptose 7-phosphate kinase/D-beta-D-heptose 1-phosphate adenosyltransferase